MWGSISGAITGAATNAVRVGQAASMWQGAGKYTPYQDMVRHYNKHVIGEGQKLLAKNIVNYTRQAGQFFANNNGAGYLLRTGIMKIAGSPGGIFTTGGKILSYWYILL